MLTITSRSPLFPIVAGALLIGIVMFFYKQVRIGQEWLAAEGQVTQVQSSWIANIVLRQATKSQPCPLVFYEYTVAEKVYKSSVQYPRSDCSSVSDQHRLLKTGDRIRIIYDPKKPSQARIQGKV